MASTSCTTKSIKLLSGESFILPPGAKVIGATDPAFLTSKDDCADLTNLETLQCYICAIPIAAENSGDEQYWESRSTVYTSTPALKGYVLNDETPVFFTQGTHSNVIGAYWFYDPGILSDNIVFQTELKTLIPGIVQTVVGNANGGNTGTLNYILIKTIPSIADNLELIVQVDSVGSLGIAYGHFKFKPIDDFAGYANLPECPSAS